MSSTTPQSVLSGCRKYVKSRIKFNTFNTFNNVMEIIKLKTNCDHCNAINIVDVIVEREGEKRRMIHHCYECNRSYTIEY